MCCVICKNFFISELMSDCLHIDFDSGDVVWHEMDALSPSFDFVIVVRSESAKYIDSLMEMHYHTILLFFKLLLRL